MTFDFLKVGLICPYVFSRPGGIQEHVKALYWELKRLGQEVKIIAPHSSGGSQDDIKEEVIFLGKSLAIGANDSTVDVSLSYKPLEIRKLLKSENFDILHFHNLGPFLSFQVLEASQAINILTLHSLTDGSKLLRVLPPLKRLFSYYLAKKIDGLILVSKVIEDWSFGFRGPKKIIPNGIDLQRFNLSALPLAKWQDGFFNLLFVGRIEKRKGLIYLLRAFEILKKKHHDLRLIVVGSGDQRQKCEDFVKDRSLKDVVFVGAVNSKDLPRYYRTADLFVSPATHGESFGIVLLEAMASGTSIVAFANNGYKEVLRAITNDCLAESRNVWQLAQKIDNLIADEKKREELKEWGLKEVQKYAWPEVARRILDFYQEVLKTKGSRAGLLLDER